MTASSTTVNGIIPIQARPDARLRLFCAPYAGGGASIYRQWPQALPETVEVCAVQPPGREQYIAKTPFTNLPDLVTWLGTEISPWLDRPYLLFGHSMGAFICFELARHLRLLGKPQPERLYVSGARAPHIPDPHPSMHQLNDTAFRHELHQLEGTPDAILQHAELMELLLPLLRADFSICETYTYHDEAPLTCPLSVFGGSNDPRVPYQHLVAWRQHTQSAFQVRVLEGRHFFIHSAAQNLLNTLAQDVQQTLTHLH